MGELEEDSLIADKERLVAEGKVEAIRPCCTVKKNTNTSHVEDIQSPSYPSNKRVKCMIVTIGGL